MSRFMEPSRKWSDEERSWWARQDYKQAASWNPPKDAVLTEGTVASLTADAQWGYKAGRSTRGAMPKPRKAAAARKPNAALRAAEDALAARDLLVAELRARVALLEGELALAEELMAA